MSLKKIAEMTGVSISTVSRVLNNTDYKCASSAMKDKIWEAAWEIGYTPNEEARRLKKGGGTKKASYQIMVLLARFDTLDTDPFFRELYRFIEEEAFQRRCVLQTVCGMEHLPETSRMDGLILLGRCPQAALPKLKRRYKCIVGVGRNPSNFEIDEIICDGKAAAVAAMEHLISLGHRKIAYIGDCSYETRFLGYNETLMSHKIPLNYAWVKPTDQTKAAGYEAMRALLGAERPTAVFCANDITASGAIQAYQETAAKDKSEAFLPSIISIDNTEEAQMLDPMLTTVNIPKGDMGRLAVKVLLDRIEGGHSECVRLELPCRLIVRDSCFVCRHF